MSHFPERIRQLPAHPGALGARRLTAKGCQVLFASYAADQRIPVHQHETDNLGVVTEGELLLTLHGVQRAYRAGGWYHIPARAPYAARFGAPTSVIEFWFVAEGSD